jgi:hypothetical protein
VRAERYAQARAGDDFVTRGSSPLTTLTARRKVELVIGFWASLALIIWAIRELLG